MEKIFQPPRIYVERSGTVLFQEIADGNDGLLTIVEAEKHTPFPIKRVYFIAGFSDLSAVRGKHAHRELSQVICCVRGTFRLTLDDGEQTQKVEVAPGPYGILLGPGLWHSMENFSADCVILVFASDHYNESDYLRDYGEFIEYIHTA